MSSRENQAAIELTIRNNKFIASTIRTSSLGINHLLNQTRIKTMNDIEMCKN